MAFDFHNNLENEISGFEQNNDNQDTNTYKFSNFITSCNVTAQPNSSCNNDKNISTNTDEDKFDEDIIIESRYIPSAFVTDHLNSDEISCASELIDRSVNNAQPIKIDSRSLTLDLEKNFKTNPVLQKPSVWDNANGRKRLIRQSTVEGIKDYFDTLERLERNSISFITKNRRYSLPLPADTSIRNKDNDIAPNKKVWNYFTFNFAED